MDPATGLNFVYNDDGQPHVYPGRIYRRSGDGIYYDDFRKP